MLSLRIPAQEFPHHRKRRKMRVREKNGRVKKKETKTNKLNVGQSHGEREMGFACAINFHLSRFLFLLFYDRTAFVLWRGQM